MVKLGRRHYGLEERRRTAIGSWVNGTIGGQSKRGMPVVETQRVPLVAAAPEATTTSGNNGEFSSSAPLTITYPEGSAGDVLLIWVMVDGSTAPSITGDLSSGELLSTISSTGRLRVYRRVRQAGDTSATFTPGGGGSNRIGAVVANIPAAMDTSAPTTSSVFASSTTVSPTTATGGPGLLAVWFSFSNIALTGTLLEDQLNDTDVTTGFELRLYQIDGSTSITQATPTNPSFSLFIRAVSYTTV